MNQGPLLFLGIFFSMVMAFGGVVLAPHLKIGVQKQTVIETTGELYPAVRGGLAKEGAEVYRSLGCVECHTQQVRGLGGDRERGWGPRITVAQDYLQEYPVLLGNLRIGPDLANVALRQPDSMPLYLKLYSPQQLVPGSMMPPYQFLFEKRKLLPGQQPSSDALPVKVQPGFEIAPTHRARALVAYLKSLKATVPLFEAPLPPQLAPATNAVPDAATNAPATNLPPATPQSAPPQ